MSAALAAAVCVAAIASPAIDEEADTGSDDHLTLIYNGSILGMRVVKAHVEAYLSADSYQTEAVFRSAGLVGFFKTSVVNAGVEGTRAGDAFSPNRYRHLEDMGKKQRRIALTYSEDGVALVAEPPFGDLGVPPASAAQKREAVDPLSAILAITHPRDQPPCDRRVRVFDSKQRYDLVFTPNGRERVRTRAFRGQAHRCRVNYQPIAGYDDGEIEENADIYRTPIHLWLADIDDGVTAPVRISATFRAGPMRIPVQVEATRATVD